MYHYYEIFGNVLASTVEKLPYPSITAKKAMGRHITVLVEEDIIRGRGRFKVNHPGQLLCPSSLDVLDANRLPRLTLDSSMEYAMNHEMLSAVNINRPRWEHSIASKSMGKRRVHILAMGDVGSTLLMGLKLLGGDVIDSIGICDLSQQVTDRWEFEMGQIADAWNYDSMPEVDVITPDELFKCDVFIFVASKGIPPVGSQVKDVRMAQFEANSAIVAHYAKQARAEQFRGIWCAVSDPVDPLAKVAYLESNRDASGYFDGMGLRPEQIQGFGLGVMNARAAYFAKRDDRFAQFLTQGRAYGPHGTGLIIANSIEHYDDALSQELTHLTVTANMKMREIGFKPYVAPALSSGALSILRTLRGEWHYSSVYLNGVYMGLKNRYTPAGLETELLPAIPKELFAHIQQAAAHLKDVL